jgi:hypothetical protein
MNKNELSSKEFFRKTKDGISFHRFEEAKNKQYVLKKLKHHWFIPMEVIKCKREIL